MSAPRLRSRCHVGAALISCIGAAATTAHAQFGCFDNPTHGWSIYGRTGQAVWSDAGGLGESGCITLADAGAGSGAWGFEFNGALDLQQVFLRWHVLTSEVADSRPLAPDVVLEGPAGIIVTRIATPPVAGEWTPREVRLDAFWEWRVGTLDGPVATPLEVYAVKRNVTRARFRAGFNESGDTTASLDCVSSASCDEVYYWMTDFNGDGIGGDDDDIAAFFRCLAGDCCSTCYGADIDFDGDVGTDADIEMFFRVIAGYC
jgi:hypothetical protein